MDVEEEWKPLTISSPESVNEVRFKVEKRYDGIYLLIKKEESTDVKEFLIQDIGFRSLRLLSEGYRFDLKKT